MNLKTVIIYAGALCAAFGIGSMALNFMGRNYSFLLWVDTWGIVAGWIIRAVMVLAGIALYLTGRRFDDR